MDIPSFVWKPFYDYIARFNVQTMNYGYVRSMSAPTPVHIDANSLRLYRLVADERCLAVLATGSVVLEIGSGRGAGLHHLANRWPTLRFVGLELSPVAVECASRTFQLPNLTFTTGDATSLPYPDASIAMVLNVESSHCYPDMDRFLAEVRRVLRPRGVLCFADFRDGCLEDIQRHLHVQYARDITPNVLCSLRLNNTLRQRQIADLRRSGSLLDRVVLDWVAHAFTGQVDSLIYRSLASGRMAYRQIRAIKST